MRTADIDENARRAFESDRISGRTRPIEHYLPATDSPAYLPTLEELILIELELAWRAGNGSGPLIEEYLARFPILNARETVFRLLEQERRVRTAYAGGLRPGEHRGRFPQWFAAEEISSTTFHEAESAAGSSPSKVPWEHPSCIGSYVVVHVLDHGGQAQVYRAVHPTLGGDVVIKLASAKTTASREERERLVAEGRILAELTHPNLARVYDLGFHEGRPFLVMEYVRGRNLEQYAKQQPLSPKRAAALVAEVASALSLAHGRGVIHKDVKPKNILVGEDDRARVIDFGLAKVQHAWAESVEPEGWISGTVQFMAPEQARGDNDRVDPRSDVFGLGGVLFYLLTGEPPYSGEQVQEILARARRGDWNRALLEKCRAPRSLKAICRRAMAAEPADRYATMADLGTDLEAVMHGARRRLFLLSITVVVGTVLALWCSRGRWLPTLVRNEPRSDKASAGAGPSLTVSVWRRQRYCPLTDAAPLREGDEIRLKADVPSHMYVALFWCDSSGQLTRLTVGNAQPARSTLEFPAEQDLSAPLTGPPGSEFVLICGRRSAPIELAELSAIWGDSSHWPSLPDATVLRLLMDEVRVEQAGRGLGSSRLRIDPEAAVRRHLEQLRSRLAAKFEYYEGLAFAHQE